MRETGRQPDAGAIKLLGAAIRRSKKDRGDIAGKSLLKGGHSIIDDNTCARSRRGAGLGETGFIRPEGKCHGDEARCSVSITSVQLEK